MECVSAWQQFSLLCSSHLLDLKAWPAGDCPVLSISSPFILLASFVVSEEEGKTQLEK